MAHFCNSLKAPIEGSKSCLILQFRELRQKKVLQHWPCLPLKFALLLKLAKKFFSFSFAQHGRH